MTKDELLYELNERSDSYNRTIGSTKLPTLKSLFMEQQRKLRAFIEGLSNGRYEITDKQTDLLDNKKK